MIWSTVKGGFMLQSSEIFVASGLLFPPSYILLYQNDNSSLLAERFQYFTGMIIQVKFWKQCFIGMMIITKCCFHSICFGP